MEAQGLRPGEAAPEAALHRLVDALKSASEAETIGILQKIGAFLINDCQIRILGRVIEPLWVEAYFFRDPGFPDYNTHKSQQQKNRFGRLYFHRRGYGGLDLCLSDSDRWYLSFLLKATLVNGSFQTQKGILNILPATGKTKTELEEQENLLVPAENDHRVAYARRVNLAKPSYGDARLAAFAMDALSQYDFGFAHRVLAENAWEYMEAYRKEHPDRSEAEYRAECRRVFGWAPCRRRG